MAKIIFILGGTRSGKSSYAIKLARETGRKIVFIATAISTDEEMKKRIELHKISRPRHWKLIEEDKNISSVFVKIRNRYEVVLVDCLGLWISNLLLENLTDTKIEREIKRLVRVISRSKTSVILVSNEVGSGIVPDNLLARRFRDLLGMANQIIAKKADDVILMQSGIPLTIKGEPRHAEIKRNIK